MAFYENERTKYDIPLNHLDHKYIPGCTDIKELEKILKVLRSGVEGSFPDLEKLAEEQISKLDPNHKLLRKSAKPLTPGDLAAEERKELQEYIDDWVEEAKEKEKKLSKPAEDFSDQLPPVRNAAGKISSDKNAENQSDVKKQNQKRVKPREYKEWDKFDVDAELNKMEEMNGEEEKPPAKRTPQKPNISESVDTSGLSNELKETKANHERNKGNEAFKAGDFEEAVIYYNRSISLAPSAAAYNNRALVYLRQKKWNTALDDCNTVLEMEPENLKAVLRRASAYQGLTQYPQAKKDLDVVLAKEPNNKSALNMLKEVTKALADQKVTGRRMKIEDVEESECSKKITPVEDLKTDEVSKTVGKSVRDAVSDIPQKGITSEKGDAENEELTKSRKDEKSSPKVSFSAGGDVPKQDDSELNLKNSMKNSAIDSQPAVTVENGGAALKGSSEASSDGANILNSAPPLEKGVVDLKDAGNELFRKGQYGDALSKYDAAIRRIPENDRIQHAVNLSVLYSNRAACKIKIGDCRGCVEDCDKSIELFPDSAKPYLRRAMAFEQMERFQEAFVDYRQAINAGLNNDVAQQGSDRCASVLQQMNGRNWRDRLPKIASFSSLTSLVSPSTSVPSAASITPTSESAETAPPAEDKEVVFERLKAEGNKLFSKGEYTEAIECFSKCIDLFPDHVVPYTNRALCYLKLGKCDSVLEDCNQALSIEFHNVKALYRRALAYKMQENYEKSLIDLETLLKLDPNNSAAKKELVLVAQCKEELQEKKAQFACLREQQKLRHRMKIKEMEGSSDEDNDKCQKSPKSGVTQSQTPSDGANISQKRPAEASLGSKSANVKLEKVTPFAFLQAWKALRFTEDVDAYADLLDQVQPQDLPKVLSSSLDGEFLMNVIRCTKSFIKAGRAARAFDYLLHLTKVPRFDMVLMFLSEAEKSEVGKLFDLLAENSKKDVNVDLLNEMRRSKYSL